jgi:hypothetical protein
VRYTRGPPFVVDLPILCEKTAADEKSKAEPAAMNLSGKQVLLVEDNYLNAEIATLMLKEKASSLRLRRTESGR